ncbi:TIR domain-containing protein [Cognatishimia sp. MH4019]|uniref:TIR domain-containing protein n=1 Tax=Cognatishimia sp. MH4019 TaxID=2854030 RepID=UPI001CD26509|nr:TIR domain-containing protein [Cognatishimia sp. MH4019]
MIFISYVSEDRSRVMPFYDLLDAHNLNPWMDHKSILSGQNWDYEITTALERCDIIIIFVSQNSVDKRGYAQKEISFALEKIKEKLKGDIYAIPVQLDRVDFPEQLKGIQFLQAYNKEQSEVEAELLRSLNAAQKKSLEIASDAQLKAEVRWLIEDSELKYNGIPGFSTSVQRIRLSSTKYAQLKDIEDHINGSLARHAMDARYSTLEPQPSFYNLMQDEWKRTNTFDAIFGSADVVGRVISVGYSLHWYSAGAAHPVHAPKSFNYLLEPIIHLPSIRNLFQSDDALGPVQAHVQRLLASELKLNEADSFDLNWVCEGTKDWDSLSNFMLTKDGITVVFGSYQVAAYALGMPRITIPYELVVDLLNESVLHALGLYRTA